MSIIILRYDLMQPIVPVDHSCAAMVSPSFPLNAVMEFKTVLDLCNLLLLSLLSASISDHVFSICAIIVSRACHAIQSATCSFERKCIDGVPPEFRGRGFRLKMLPW